MIHFVSVFPPYRGGIARFSDYVYQHLRKNTGVAAYNFKKLYPGLLFPGASQFEEEPSEPYAKALLHSYNPLNWQSSGSSLARLKPDTLLFSYWHPFFIPAYKSLIKKVRKEHPEVKVATIIHNVNPHEGFPFSGSLMRSFFNANDLLITLSSQTGQELDELDIDTKRLALFHPYYEQVNDSYSSADLREKYGLLADEKVILFFGLVRSYKGLDLFIQALNGLDLKKRKVRPFIVGEFYEDKDRYLKLITPEHRAQYTILDRFVSQEEANEIFSLSDLLVLPYKTASQSGVFNDALNFNLPALVADHPGLTEHLEHRKTGLIFPKEDVQALRGQLDSYLAEEGLAKKIRANLEGLKQDLSWEKFCAKLRAEL